MALVRMFRKNRSDAAGSLGAVQRSIGYLQGGYKDSTIHSKVQLFNTITQVGQIVYDTGYQRRYRPGISGMNAGYFSINDNVQYNKFNYITASAFAVSFTTPTHPGVSSVDFGVYSTAWLLTKPTNNTALEAVDNWNSINLSTDALTSLGNLSSAVLSSTRQAISTAQATGFWNNTPNTIMFNHTTRAVATTTGFAADSYPCGMSRDNTYAYLIGATNAARLTFSGTSLAAIVGITPFSYQFGESHSISSSSAGYMMAGYADTTGRYGSTQHGLCQKMTFSNESYTTLADLVLPQSSGQMMQGF